MLSDRVLTDVAESNRVCITVRVPYSIPLVFGVVSIGTLSAFASLVCLPLMGQSTMFFCGIFIAFSLSLFVFCYVLWLVYGYERFTTYGSTFVYEWRAPGTGLGGLHECDMATMGPLELNPIGKLGFIYQNKFISIGKALRTNEKLEFLQLMATQLPHLVNHTTVTVSDNYYPIDIKENAAAPIAMPIPVAVRLAPPQQLIQPSEAHI